MLTDAASHTRSPQEISDIISKQPPFIVRWGITIFFFILLSMVGACWFVSYPDLVMANARLTGLNTPRPVVSRTDGRLLSLLAQESEWVQKDQVLGFMESVAHANDVLQLEHWLDTLQQSIYQNNNKAVASIFNYLSQMQQGPAWQLGELHSNWQQFMQVYLQYINYINTGFFVRKKQMLAMDVAQLNQMKGILQYQQKLQEQDLALSQQTFNAQKALAAEKVISPFEYRQEQSKLIGKELSLPQLEAGAVSNQMQQLEKQKELANLDNDIFNQHQVFRQALYAMQAQVQLWKQQYVLTAPDSGKVLFAAFYQPGQLIRSGQVLLYVSPPQTQYFAELLVPQYNFGRVSTGQQVRLKLQAYPFEQFGALEGHIEAIQQASTDSGFLARVKLPDSLITQNDQPIFFREGLTAQAEIITDNLNLLQRLYYNAVRVVQR
jgi:HlyD family secretion protein